MRKRTVIIPLAVMAAATPSGVFVAKKLDTSSTAPVISINTTEWTNSAIVNVSEAASFGGSDLDHYEYCINSANNIESCEWKNLTVSNIRIRTSGTSYIWVRGVSQYNVISEPSNLVIAQVDRTKPDGDATLSSSTSSIQITVSASDDTDIASYMYSINDSDYIKGDAQYTFSNLAANTTYTIKVKITDLANNAKYLSFKQSTDAVASVKKSQSARKSSTSLASTHGASNHKSPSRSGNSKPSAKPSGELEQAEENPKNTVDNTTEILPETDPESKQELSPEENPNTDSSDNEAIVDDNTEPVTDSQTTVDDSSDDSTKVTDSPTAINDSSDNNAEVTDENEDNDETSDSEDDEQDEAEESEEDSSIVEFTDSTETI